ncbi:MAG: beta-propeller fold lactonase family protein [Thermoanaerobaculia bacterium]|nr:beta-propeller fold lactonase family protein [Thermoanaerobaculia bacterium]
MTVSFLNRILPGLLVLVLGLLLTPDHAPARVLELVDQEEDVRMRNIRDLEVSPDGRYVYLTGLYNRVRFLRDEATGTLTFVATGDPALSFALSPDGRTTYSTHSATLRAHTRNVQDGTLSLVEEWSGPLTLGPYEDGARAVWLSPDGRHAYVAIAGGISVFQRDPHSGFLTWVQTLFDGVGDVEELEPTDLTFSADGQEVYVTSASHVDFDGIVVFTRDIFEGSLTWKQYISNETFAALKNARRLQASSDGRNVYLLGVDGVVSLERDSSSGTLTFMEVDGGPAPKTLVLGPKDRFVYVFRNHFIEIYSRRSGTGALDLKETVELPMNQLTSVVSAKFSPDGRHLYLATSYSSPRSGGIAVLARDSGSGGLSLIESMLGDVVGDADGIHTPEAAIVSPDGLHLYIGSEELELELAAFSRSNATGLLSYTGSYSGWNSEGLATAEDLAMSPDSRHLYMFSRRPTGRTLAVLAREESTGALTLVESHESDSGLSLRSSVVVSPDGRNLYIPGRANGTDALVIFDRDTVSGRIEYRGAIDGIPALDGVKTVGIDKDGKNIYAEARTVDRGQLAVFRRDTVTGDLSFLEAHDVTPAFHSEIDISPDGRNLYLGGENLSIFARGPLDGRLAFLEEHEGSPTLSHVGLHVSPNGAYVYSFNDDDVSVYGRDRSTGGLTLLESEGIPAGASAVSPAGDFAYFSRSSRHRDAIHIYRIEEGPCRANWDGLCLADDRFQVGLEWRDFEGNTGTAHPVHGGSDDSGILWFFGPNNWEMQIKVLDACNLNDRFWVFAAATTNVEYTLSVTDVVAGLTKSYYNPLGNAAGAITDTDAFASCSGSNSTTASASRSVDLSTSSGTPAVRRAYKDNAKLYFETFDYPGQVVGLGDKCLDVEGGDPTDGAPIILNDCHGGENQRWEWVLDDPCPVPYGVRDFELRVFGHKCLQPGDDVGSGTRQLEIGSCTGSDDLWYEIGYYPNEFSLRHIETGLCADVLGANTDNRTPVVLYECHEGDNQRWTFDEFRCKPSPTRACKNRGRFLVEVEWRDFEGNSGGGRVVPQASNDSGLFWFFGPDNWEMLVKVLDGCGLNEHFWVFAAATTNVEYTLRVTDTQTREVREYFNPLDNAAPAITDTAAFECTAP